MEKRDYIKRKPVKPNPSQLVFGIRPVIEAIKSGREIDKLLIQKGLSGEIARELYDMLKNMPVHIQQVPVESLNKIVRSNHQGVIAFISMIQYASLDHIISEAFRSGKEPKVILLDRITDVRNFGAIARTAEGLGFDAIVIPVKGSAQINDDALKTSAGALNFIPVCRENNLNTAIRFLKDSGLTILACTEKAAATIYETDISGPLALLFGSEEDGISPDLLRQAHYLAKIPMFGSIASFNVSVSVAIVAGEVIRKSLA